MLKSYPLRQVLQKLEASGRLLKWPIELSQFDVCYRSRITIKGQAFAHFVVKFTYSNIIEIAGTSNVVEAAKEVEMEKDKTTKKMLWDSDLHGEQWILYVDEASNENGSGVDMMLISTEEYKINCALWFRFQASNNEAEYKTLLAGLRLAKELKVSHLKVYSDS